MVWDSACLHWFNVLRLHALPCGTSSIRPVFQGSTLRCLALYRRWIFIFSLRRVLRADDSHQRFLSVLPYLCARSDAFICSCPLAFLFVTESINLQSIFFCVTIGMD